MKYKDEIITGSLIIGVGLLVVGVINFFQKRVFILSDEETDMIRRNREELAAESVDSKSSTDPEEAVGL